MDLNKIFLKDACPTKMGGQAVMEGIMMRGEEKTALTVRVPDGGIIVKTQPTKTYGGSMKIPLVRGVVAFFDSLVFGVIFQIFYYLCRINRFESGCEYPERIACGNSRTFPTVIYSYQSFHGAKLTIFSAHG